MTEMNTWIPLYLDRVKKCFGNRILLAGLQGSWNRGEAEEGSDIDVVLILDELSGKDLVAYERAVRGLRHRERLCGFLAGKKELWNWDKADLFQFYQDTEPFFGKLEDVVPEIRQEDVRRAVHAGACNLYHMAAHNLVFDKNLELLKDLYKSARFTLQAKYFEKTGCFIRQKQELRNVLEGRDREILRELMRKQEWKPEELEALSETLFEWARETIGEISQKRNGQPV